MTPPTTAVRLARAAVVALLALVLLPPPAQAAGTGGIEVTPIPGVVDGKQVTSFKVQAPGEGTRQVPFALRNLTKDPRTARLYVASAVRQDDGSWAIGGPGSSRHAQLPEQEVTLPAEKVQRRSFTVRGGIDKTTYAAVVIEVRRGSVVTRAATLITLSPPDQLPVPLLLGLGAAAVALAAGTAVALATRRRKDQPEPDPAG